MQQLVERMDNRLIADRFTIALKVTKLCNHRFFWEFPGKPDRSHRLIRHPTIRPGNARNRDRHLRPLAGNGTIRHLARRLLRYRAEINQRIAVNAQHRRFRFIAVGHEGAIEPGRRAGNTRNRLGNTATGAGFCRGEHQAAAFQCRAQLGGEGRDVFVVHK